jgi:hypothetical protein
MTILTGEGWPFEVHVIGDDLVVPDTLITCFGGIGNGVIFDPDDSGRTASGRNTKIEEVAGVALPLNTENRTGVDAATHRALDGSPIPWLPWGTFVEVTIKGVTFTPPDGLVDIGPSKRVQKPGNPKALDLTVWAARHFDKALHSEHQMTPKQLAREFEARGSYRIIGGAKFIK